MKIFPNYPNENEFRYCEIFEQERYKEKTIDEQNSIKMQSAKYLYDYEKQLCYFDRYFPNISSTEFYMKTILDMGCFTGGRLVYWVERYSFKEARGIDIHPIYAETGNLFAKSKNINATFDTGFAERLPYPSNHFDYIVSYDVLEHVKNIEMVMSECFRVLKPGGKFCAVFPPFYQPFESHLTLVTKVPALHWFFSGKTLTAAWHEILQERGKGRFYYVKHDPHLEEWEKLPFINGITVAGFRQIIKMNKGWRLLYWGKDPILSIGRRANLPIFFILRYMFILPARLPVFEEFFLGRVCCMLEKADEKNS